MESDAPYSEHENAKFLRIVSRADVPELRSMLNEAQRKVMLGVKRRAPCGYTAAERAVFYQCELISRGESING